MENNVLVHHGIKGQKWYIRRFQNKDGSLTKAGKKRYSEDSENRDNGNDTKKSFGLSKKKSTNSSESDNTPKKEMTKEEIEKKKESVLKSKSAKTLYENKDLFDDRELQAAYNRLVLENNVRNLSSNEVSKGEQYVDDIIKWGRKANDLADTGIKLYNNTAKIYNAFSESGKDSPLPLIKSDDKDKKKKEKRSSDDNSLNNKKKNDTPVNNTSEKKEKNKSSIKNPFTKNKDKNTSSSTSNKEDTSEWDSKRFATEAAKKAVYEQGGSKKQAKKAAESVSKKWDEMMNNYGNTSTSSNDFNKYSQAGESYVTDLILREDKK